MTIVMGLKNCDSCRKAVRELGEAGRDVILRDIREEPLGDVERAGIIEEFGADIVNRRSTTWRGLSEAERAGSEADLLARHPALMKRPVVISDGKKYLGWGEETRKSLLK